MLSPRIWTPPPSPPLNSEWPRLRKLKWHVKTWGSVGMLKFGFLAIYFYHLFIFYLFYLHIDNLKSQDTIICEGVGRKGVVKVVKTSPLLLPF